VAWTVIVGEEKEIEELVILKEDVLANGGRMVVLMLNVVEVLMEIMEEKVERVEKLVVLILDNGREDVVVVTTDDVEEAGGSGVFVVVRSGTGACVEVGAMMSVSVLPKVGK